LVTKLRLIRDECPSSSIDAQSVADARQRIRLLVAEITGLSRREDLLSDDSPGLASHFALGL
jgi:hypothetical protein